MAHSGPFTCQCGRIHFDQYDGPSNDLLPYIDTEGVAALNESERGACRRVFKPYEERQDRTKFMDSEEDDPQVIIHIPFTCPVKIRAIVVMGGPEGAAPLRLRAFINREALDFSDAEDAPATQEWELAEDLAGVIEVPTQFSRFQSVSKLTLFVASNHGADSTRIYYIGLSGVGTDHKRKAVYCVYETQGCPDMAVLKDQVAGSQLM